MPRSMTEAKRDWVESTVRQMELSGFEPTEVLNTAFDVAGLNDEPAQTTNLIRIPDRLRADHGASFPGSATRNEHVASSGDVPGASSRLRDRTWARARRVSR